MTSRLGREAIERAAQALYGARASHRLLASLPVGCRPHDLDEAYAIQDRLVELIGDRTAGWFAGCTNPAIQRQLGLPGPYAARLLAASVMPSPARLDTHGLPIVLEVEFGFTMRTDLPPRADDYEEAEVAEAIATVHPAIEVVIGHFEDWVRHDVFSLIADNGTDGALVIGKGVPYRPALALDEIGVRLRVDSEVVREGRGRDVWGGPIAALVFVANHSASHAQGLKSGDVVNTGTCTAMYFAKAGSVAVAEFEGLGEVRLALHSGSESSPSA
jgi:2-keto-4-pentenoate hydratase